MQRKFLHSVNAVVCFAEFVLYLQNILICGSPLIAV